MTLTLINATFALNFSLVRQISYNQEPPEVQITWSNGDVQVFTGQRASAIIDYFVWGDLFEGQPHSSGTPEQKP